MAACETQVSLASDTSASVPKVLAVIPAFNEELSVAGVIAELRDSNPHVDILVVDDGSRDATASRARDAGAVVCSLPYNLGVGGAMRAGYRYALAQDYDVVVQVDADGQHDPRYLPALLRRLDEGYDIVIGARFAGLGKYSARGPRRWAMLLLAATLSHLARTRLTDVTSGFRAANRRAISTFAAYYPAEYLGDTVESLVIALRTGCAVGQEPVEMRQRLTGEASQTTLGSVIFLARATLAVGLGLVRRWPSVFEVAPKGVA